MNTLCSAYNRKGMREKLHNLCSSMYNSTTLSVVLRNLGVTCVEFQHETAADCCKYSLKYFLTLLCLVVAYYLIEGL